MYELGMTIDERISRLEPLGQFCSNCMKPIGFSVVAAVRLCDGCEKYYVPTPSPETYPIKYFLCQECDKPVPARPRFKKVS